jgi:hypothetical protein
MFELFNSNGIKLSYGSYPNLKLFAKVESLKDFFIIPAV